MFAAEESCFQNEWTVFLQSGQIKLSQTNGFSQVLIFICLPIITFPFEHFVAVMTHEMHLACGFSNVFDISIKFPFESFASIGSSEWFKSQVASVDFQMPKFSYYKSLFPTESFIAPVDPD